jgi:hypothetical protein
LAKFVDVNLVINIMASAGEDGFDFGFNMQNVQRNAFLERAGLKTPKAMSTGTTIVGLVYKDGVILGADTRCVVSACTAARRGRNQLGTACLFAVPSPPFLHAHFIACGLCYPGLLYLPLVREPLLDPWF